VAIPVKLPAPDEGTEEQPEPKSIADAPEEDGIAEDDGIADEADEAGAAAELLELPELLHAAAPTARPAATTDTARVRLRIVTPYIISVIAGDKPVLEEVIHEGKHGTAPGRPGTVVRPR
jgi:hypothetical protein